MPTSAQILAVRADADLRERIVALASLDPGITSATSWVDAHIERIAAAPLNSTGNDTIASVLNYAREEYRPYKPDAIRPGLNPGAVTDAHLLAAIAHVRDTEAA